MKTALILLLLTLSPFAWATYSIEAEIERKDAKNVQGKIQVEEGIWKTALLGDLELKIFLTRVTQENRGIVKINTEISTHTKGTSTLIAKPTLLARLNHDTQFSSKDPDGALDFRIKLTPRDASIK